jgi:hypothetical protein
MEIIHFPIQNHGALNNYLKSLLRTMAGLSSHLVMIVVCGYLQCSGFTSNEPLVMPPKFQSPVETCRPLIIQAPGGRYAVFSLAMSLSLP